MMRKDKLSLKKKITSKKLKENHTSIFEGGNKKHDILQKTNLFYSCLDSGLELVQRTKSLFFLKKKMFDLKFSEVLILSDMVVELFKNMMEILK